MVGKTPLWQNRLAGQARVRGANIFLTKKDSFVKTTGISCRTVIHFRSINGGLPRSRNPQLLADSHGGVLRDLAVSRDRGSSPVRRVLSIGVVATLADEPATVLAEMPQEISSLHGFTLRARRQGAWRRTREDGSVPHSASRSIAPCRIRTISMAAWCSILCRQQGSHHVTLPHSSIISKRRATSKIAVSASHMHIDSS